MSKFSRDKGIRGELEVSKLLKGWGWEAERGKQRKGGPDSPDVIHNMHNLRPAGISFALEIKLRQQLNLYDALKKLEGEQDPDAGMTPVVFHRKDHKPWLVTLSADDFLEIVHYMHNFEEIGDLE
tara:strand:+ start:616 stop:990 length:375 start_codon:yes stop_codon:yes gene_type:complete